MDEKIKINKQNKYTQISLIIKAFCTYTDQCDEKTRIETVRKCEECIHQKNISNSMKKKIQK